MHELRKLNEAIVVVEKYSDYLARKAWGKTLIIWGIIAPIGLILYFSSPTLSALFNMDRNSFSTLTSFTIVLIGIGITLYNFLTASRVLKTKDDRSVSSPKKSSLHGIIIGFIWFFLYLLAGVIPDPYSVVSSVWAAGLAIIISYVLLKNFFHDTFPELLLVGIILLIASLPLVIIAVVDWELARIITVIIFSISFLAGGFYSFLEAPKILSRNE